jgi:excisionase family DNA binding protein
MSQESTDHRDATPGRDAERLTLSVREAASVLGVSQRTIERLVADGTLRSVTLNRRRLIPRKALDELVEPGTDGTPGRRAERGLRDRS